MMVITKNKEQHFLLYCAGRFSSEWSSAWQVCLQWAFLQVGLICAAQGAGGEAGMCWEKQTSRRSARGALASLTQISPGQPICSAVLQRVSREKCWCYPGPHHGDLGPRSWQSQWYNQQIHLSGKDRSPPEQQNFSPGTFTVSRKMPRHSSEFASHSMLLCIPWKLKRSGQREGFFLGFPQPDSNFFPCDCMPVMYCI